ncbi:hypothetical protein D3C84_528110 [compost metagenome]
MVQLQHVGGLGAVGPGVGAVLAVVEVELRVEAGVGRCLFVFQVELGQLGEGVVLGIGLVVPGRRDVLRPFRDVQAVRRFGRYRLGAFVFLEVAAFVLLDAKAVGQQVVALAFLLVIQALDDEQQVAALARPVQQAVGLARSHARATAEQQKRLAGAGQGVEHFQAIGARHLQAALAQELLRGQVGIAQHFRRGSVLDGFLVRLQAPGEIDGQEPQQQGQGGADEEAWAQAHALAPVANRRRQPSQRPWRDSAAGSRWP